VPHRLPEEFSLLFFPPKAMGFIVVAVLVNPRPLLFEDIDPVIRKRR